MHDADTSVVRRFNRTVTQRVGALDDEYLSRGRPLGAARVLWEVGPDGIEVAALRARLGLDSGYLSRLLRSLEAEGLVRVGASGSDARVREARLSRAGTKEWRILDEESDDLARSILAPLSEGQRDRLVAAMAEVERLLTASMVTLEECLPGDPRARACLRAYARDVGARFDHGFDPARSLPVDDHAVTPPAGLLLLGTLSTEPIGCGSVKFHSDGVGEIKRLWVSDSVRGLGVGRRILTELERHAREHGCDRARLDTNRNLTEAIALYRSAGYVEVPAYNDEPYAHHWFEKMLG